VLLDTEDARQQVARAAGADGAAPRSSQAEEEELHDLALFVGRCQACLDDLAEHHLYPSVRILGDD